MTTTCLFLKPQVITPEGRERQKQDIETFIKPAFDHAGLTVLDNQLDGLAVSDISSDIIQKIYKADILVVDANCYETSGFFLLSPYLYYYIAIGHSRGNATILVANSLTHLPHNLIKHHTLAYSLPKIWYFINSFKTAIEGIQLQSDETDNPIQEYHKNLEAQEALARARQEIAQLQKEKEEKARASQKPGKQGNSSIIFRKI